MTTTVTADRPTIRLRDYQTEARDSAINALMVKREDGSFPHPALVLPTGGGKTVVFSAVGDKWHELNGLESVVCILVHRDELMQQAVDKYMNVVPGARIGIIQGDKHIIQGRTVVVMSVQSMNAARLQRLGNWRPGLLIIDECHHASSMSYRRVINWAQCPVLGVTATLARSDGKALGRDRGGVFDSVVFERTILWMIRNGYLCDVEGKSVIVEDLDLTGMKKRMGDYSEKEISERILGSSAVDRAVEAIKQEVPDGTAGIIFAPSVEAAHEFTTHMREAGYSCETVWGAMPKEKDELGPLGNIVQKSRRRILREYNQGQIDWLSNCMVLTEGFDAPRATVAVIARPTQSNPLYIQMVGRVLRLFPGKAKALVLDLVGAASQNELSTLTCLAGKEPEDTKGKTLLELFGTPCEACMVPEDECLWQEGEPCCERCTHRPLLDGTERPEPRVGALKTVETDLFGSSRQQWLQTAAGFWFIPAGKRLIAIAPRSDGLYDVIWTFQDAAGGGFIVKSVPDMGYAMAQGESAITADEETVAGKARGWRKTKASEKQVAFARQLGCYVDGMEGWRKGQVADAISKAKASRRLDRMISKRLEGAK